MKKWLAVLLCVTMLVSLCSCSNEAENTMPTKSNTVESAAGPTVSVGLCLPNQSEQRWITEGATLKTALEANNCTVKLSDAENNTQLQVEQIEKLVKEKVECLVVAAVDSAALGNCLAQAKSAGIPVIAYDRLLINTDAVTGYVGFDYEKLGMDVAQRIVSAKALETAQAEGRSHTVEFFMDTYQNHSNVLYYQGLMQGLKSYLDAGVLICQSGRIRFEDICVKNTDLQTAQSLCDDLLSDYYEETWPEILVTGNDVLTDGCVAALESYSCPPESWPLIAGLNASAAEVTRIAAGKQLLTVYYDRTILAQTGAAAVEAVLAGEAVGDQKLENGAAVVPGVLQMPELVTAENYKALLVDTGIFALEETVPEETAPEETIETQENPDDHSSGFL